jgi:hypothetical protein
MKTRRQLYPGDKRPIRIHPKGKRMIDERLDKSVFSFTTLDQADADDVDYWLTKSVSARIDALEYIRRWAYGDDQVDAKIQRVFTIARLGED